VLTVPEVLARIGHPAGRRVGARWRTTCPIHRGDNVQSFSYTAEVWHCFRCGESGGQMKLARALGVLEEPVPRPGVEGVPDIRDVLRRERSVPEPLSPSAQLAAIGQEAQQILRAQADRIHLAADQAQTVEIPRWLDLAGYFADPLARGEVFDIAARWWSETWRWKDLAHQLYAFIAFDPVVADENPELVLWLASESRYCGCAELAWSEQGTRERPRLG
jgi:hypothetical protein